MVAMVVIKERQVVGKKGRNKGRKEEEKQHKNYLKGAQ